MKYFRISGIFLLLVIALAAAGCRANKKESVPENAIITHLYGKVTLLTADGKQRFLSQSDVKSPQGIMIAGDTVRTDTQSGLDLQFRDGSVVRIYEKSEFHLTSLAVSADGNERSIKGTLKTGGLYTLVYPVKNNSEYRIVTPTAIASVRGTGFEAEADDDSTDVRVTEGEVEVENTITGEKVVLKENQEITCTSTPGMIVRETNKERIRIIKETQEEIRRIREETKAEIQRIRETFREQKEEIRGAFEQQKKEILDQFEGSKAAQREQFEAAKEEMKAEKEKVTEESKAALENQKAAQKEGISEAKEAAKSGLGQGDTKSQLDAIRSARPQPGSLQ